MSLLHPTPGELIDRFTILSLKEKAIIGSQTDPSIFYSEQVEINEFIVKAYGKPPEAVWELWKELQHINSRLWDSENDIRSTGENTPEHLAIVGKNIARHNDERNRLIREIDKAYGCENPVEEKIYLRTAQK